MKGCKLCEMYEHQHKMMPRSGGAANPTSPPGLSSRLLNYCSHITPIRSSSVGSSGSACDTSSSSSSLSALSPTIPPPPPSALSSSASGGGSTMAANLAQSFGIMQPHFRDMFYATHLFSRGYYQPAGPLISPHVLPPAPPSNAGLVTTKRVPSPLDSDPDQLQQPPPSTSAAESSDSEVLITGGDLTTFRYPTQQQTQSQQLSVLSSQQQQQQQQQTSPYSRSMHQMHYPPAYPPSYYSPYPGDAMCYSPPYQPYFPAKVYQSAPAYRRYPAYYQPGHPPPTELYEAQPPSSAAPPPPTGSQLVPAGPTAPQHMEHYPGPPGFYPGYSPGGGQCYSRGIQPPYMEYPPPCPCPMQSCPKNGLTGPLIGSNNSGSNSSTNVNSNSISNGIGTSSNSTSNSNNSISNNNNTTSSSLNTISQPLKASKGPVQSVQQQHTMKSHNHILGPVEPTSQMPNGPILGKTLLHHHHVHQCKMEIMEPLKSDMEPEVKSQVISTDDSKSSQYEEVAVPPTPPSSYTVNDKLLEPEITVSPARGSTGLPTVPDQTDKAASTPTVAANAPQAPTAATIPRENLDTVASTNLPSVIGRKARIGKSMAREMMYGAHALHHPSHTPLSQHPQMYSSHTHSHHHLTSHKPSELTITTKPLPAEPTAPELDKIKQEPIKTEEEDVVLILDDEKKIKSEPEIVEVFDDSKTDSASKDNDPPNSSEDSEENPDVEFVDPPRQLNSKRIKILEFGKAQCKKSPPNGYKSLIKQTEPKPYLCQSRTPEKKDRYMKIMTKGGIRKRKLMLTEQQKKRLIMRKRKLLLLEKKRQASSQERSERSNKVISKGGSSANKEIKQRGTNPQGTKQIAQMELLPATPVEHTTDCIARGYFSEPEIPISTGRKIRKSKPNEARSKSETKKSQSAAKASANASTKNNSAQQRQQPQNLSESSDNLSEEYFTTISRYTTVRKGKQTKKGCRRKSSKTAKGGKSSTEANSEVLSETEDLNQNSAEKTTSVNINNNILETNNNKFLDNTTSLEEETSQDEANYEDVQQHQVFSFPQPPKRARSRTKFGSRKRQKTRHSIANEVLEPVVPRKLNVVPRWNNGWSWEGEPYQGKVFLNSDDPPVLRTCYPAMRHTEGDLIRPRDCVLLRAGTKKNELPYVAKVAHLWENPEDGEMMMSLLWYYRPEHTEQGRQRHDCSDEVFASRHRDHNSVACIEDKCYVLTFSEYCRYRRSVRAAEEGIEEQISIVPRLQNYCNPREVPANTNPELVLFCQRVYEFRLKRLMKTPNNNN